MLTVQLVTAVPLFVLVIGCLFYSLWIVYVQPRWVVYLRPVSWLEVRCLPRFIQTWLRDPTRGDGQSDAHEHFVKSLGPAVLLVIGQQGLLGALVWPAVALLTITAYLGTSRLTSSANPEKFDDADLEPEPEPEQFFAPRESYITPSPNEAKRKTIEPLLEPREPGSCVWQIVVVLFAVVFLAGLFVIMAWAGLIWGTVYVAVIVAVVCTVVVTGDQHWEYEERERRSWQLCSWHMYSWHLCSWHLCSIDDSLELEQNWQKGLKGVITLEIPNPEQIGLHRGATRRVNLATMTQENSETGETLNVRRSVSWWYMVPRTTLFNIRQELGTPEMCLVYTLVLTSFWCYTVLRFNGAAAELPFTEHMCERLYQPDGTERFGHLLDVDMGSSIGWDIALFLVLLLHRHRLRRRGEWRDELNSDLSKLAERSFSLLPTVAFWDRTLLVPLKKHVAKKRTAIQVQQTVQRKVVIGVKLSTWTMTSLALAQAAASLGMMCMFDDIPVAFSPKNAGGSFFTWTGQVGDSCSSDHSVYLIVIVGLIVFFTVVGMLSWAAVCDTTEIKTKTGKDEAESKPVASAASAPDAPDDDGYIPILCWQLVALPLVVALYFERTGQSASQISQSVTQSSTVPTSIVALGCGVFVLIIADRAVYMLESRTSKLLMLWGSLLAFCAYWISTDSLTDGHSVSWSWTGSWSVRLMIACSMYFYQSAKQLERKLKRNPKRRFTRYNSVPGDKNTWVHTLRTPIRKTPFLMELVYLVREHRPVTCAENGLTFAVRFQIDWLCTRTALPLFCYIRVEEIYTNLCVALCSAMRLDPSHH